MSFCSLARVHYICTSLVLPLICFPVSDSVREQYQLCITQRKLVSEIIFILLSRGGDSKREREGAQAQEELL